MSHTQSLAAQQNLRAGDPRQLARESRRPVVMLSQPAGCSQRQPTPTVGDSADPLTLGPARTTASPDTARGLSEHKKKGHRPELSIDASSDAACARRDMENLRWPDGPICPRCRGTNVVRLNGAAGKLGQLNCRRCRRKFTVTVGTRMHASHLSIATWAKSMHLIAAAPRRYSSARLRRDLELSSQREGGIDAGITYETAKRIRQQLRRKKNPRATKRANSI